MDLEEAEKRINEKINAPKRQSAWARERQQAEAKKREDEAANAALLKSFEQSFDFDSRTDDRPEQIGRGLGGGPRGFAQQRNDGWNKGPRSGPGSLDAYDRPGPPDRKKRRALEEARMLEERRGERQHDRRDFRPEHSRSTREREPEEPVLPKPCIHLSSLPPGMTTEQLKAILSPLLTVGPVRFHAPPDGPRPDCKKSITATAWLAPDTTTKQIDDAVTQLRDRYVGCGFTMKASRLASNSNLHLNLNGPGEQPFGAQRVQTNTSLRNAPPPEDGRFAPPDSYDRRGPVQRDVEVNFDRCLDLPTTRLIHTVADRLLSQNDAGRALEMEALLMSLPEVQTDSRFSFLYDSRCLAGLYYRYCLWGGHAERNDRASQDTEQIFEDVRAKWRPPTKRMPYSKLTELSYAVRDADYISSDEESEDEQKQVPAFESLEDVDALTKISISPLQRARLTHLLARLPTVNSRLRKGDLARVTNFAISNAAIGIEEIVDMLLLNVDMPFSLCLAAKYEQADEDADVPMPSADDDEEYDPENPLPSIDEQHPSSDALKLPSRDTDPSSAKLVSLYAISDILHAITSSEGAKNAWKYRQLFEQGFKSQKTFERLATLDREYGWGKMKAEQWKRKIGVLFDLWESSSAFSSDVIKALKASFSQDPKERANSVSNEQSKDTPEVKKPKWIGQWMTGSTTEDQPTTKKGPTLLDPESLQFTKHSSKHKGQEKPLDTADATVEPEAMEQSHSAEPHQDIEMADMPSSHDDHKPAQPAPLDSMRNLPASSDTPSKPTPAPKRRMRAEDMFADSDED